MIELYHYYDAEKMQIVIDPENPPEQNNKTDPSKNLAVWHSQLKIASQKVFLHMIIHLTFKTDYWTSTSRELSTYWKASTNQ